MITVNRDKLKSLLYTPPPAPVGFNRPPPSYKGYGAWLDYKSELQDAVDELLEQGLTEQEAARACNQLLS